MMLTRSTTGRRIARAGSARFVSSLTELSLIEAATGLREGRFTSVQLTEACLARQSDTRSLNAYITETAEAALASARESDARLQARKPLSWLDGVPLAVKDNFCTEGVLTTCASKVLANFVPPYESTASGRLKEAGSIMVGKTNMDEFAMGGASLYSHAGPVRNPWSPEGHVAGGSSGGSAVAVSVGSCFGALGSDTGGSVRQPAAYCGVVGFKPSYGRIPRHGLVAYASSLDTVGLFARTVGDAALLLDVTAGPDEHDTTCMRAAPEGGGKAYAVAALRVLAAVAQNREAAAAAASAAANEEAQPAEGVLIGGGKGLNNGNAAIKGDKLVFEGGILATAGPGGRPLRVGVPAEYRVEELPTPMVEVWTRGVQWLREAGAETVEVSLPHTRHALPAYYVIAGAEAASNLSRYDGVRYGHRASDEELEVAAAELAAEEGAEDQDLAESEDAGAALHALYKANRSGGFGDEVQRRILSGCFVLSEGAIADYYENALLVRQAVRDDFHAVFGSGGTCGAADGGAVDANPGAAAALAVDVLLAPVAPSAAFPVEGTETDPVQLFVNDVMTIPANLAGLPAISVPVAMESATGAGGKAVSLPLALQLIGPQGGEVPLLQAATALEAAAEFDKHALCFI
jgi:aspartyl-tRNA(Asn)/glutamyl-tRNA(Gln) amidotransferase subunit A